MKHLNWKKRPLSVLQVAVPLFALGMVLGMAYALIQGLDHGNWIYMGIYLALLIPATWELRFVVQAIKQIKEESEDE